MYENTEKFVDLNFEQKVRQTAYHLWENDGRPEGKETEYWFRAMEQLLADRVRPEVEEDKSI
jgi:hypothetical protein